MTEGLSGEHYLPADALISAVLVGGAHPTFYVAGPN